jgi:hypothetical protein
MKLKGKKTYILAIGAALYQVAYASGLIQVDPETHAMILGLFGSGVAVTLRQGVADKPEDKKEMPGS